MTMLDDLSFQFSPLWPLWLTVPVVAALFLATAYGVFTLLRKKVRPRWVAVLGGLRLAVLAVVLLVLLQPAVSYTRTVEPLPEVVVFVDTAKSMAQPAGASGKSRLDEAVAALRQGELAAALRERFRLRWFRYDRTASPVEEGDLARLRPGDDAARLADSLAGACDLVRAEGGTPQRVLVVSDGNDRGGTDPAEAARRLGVTVDVLAPAAKRPAGPARLAIADVQGARRVLLGSETHFRLSVLGPAADKDRTLTARLFEDGKEVQDVRLTLKAGRDGQSFTLAHRPGSAGLKQYEFRLRGPGGQGGPAKKLSVQVVDGKYEVLLLEDTWRWEYRFLHRLFEDDPSFRFTALLSRGRGRFVQFASPDRRVNLVGFPQGRAELEPFDIFFLGDVNPARWPRGLAASLAGLVIDEGKSLVVIAGPGLGRLADVPELHALLPVDLARDAGAPVRGPIDVRLRPDAAHSPFFFQLAPGQAQLPALDQVYPVVRKRPGATVLLEAAKHRNAYGNRIVLAEHTVGRGRVLFVGTDTLWKWQTLAPGDGPTPYSVFWQQAFRALAPGRTRLGPVSLWLKPGRTRGDAGGRMEVEAEVQSDRPLPGARVQATAELPDGRRLPLAFTPDGTNPRFFRAELSPPAAGLYIVRASLLAEGKAAAEGITSFEVEAPPGGQGAAVDRLALARLAAATGGRLIDPARPGTWPAAEGRPPPAVRQARTFDLWNSFALLLVLCGLLGADWLVRLVKGLV
jgi:hypothetical protein